MKITPEIFAELKAADKRFRTLMMNLNWENQQEYVALQAMLTLAVQPLLERIDELEYVALQAMLTLAVQPLLERIDELEADIETLEGLSGDT